MEFLNGKKKESVVKLKSTTWASSEGSHPRPPVISHSPSSTSSKIGSNFLRAVQKGWFPRGEVRRWGGVRQGVGGSGADLGPGGWDKNRHLYHKVMIESKGQEGFSRILNTSAVAGFQDGSWREGNAFSSVRHVHIL